MTDNTQAELRNLLGDCLELMKDIPDGSVDMILADLPYGTKSRTQTLMVSQQKSIYKACFCRYTEIKKPTSQ